MMVASPRQVMQAWLPALNLKLPSALMLTLSKVTVAPGAIVIFTFAPSVPEMVVPSTAITSSVTVARLPSQGSTIVAVMLFTFCVPEYFSVTVWPSVKYCGSAVNVVASPALAVHVSGFVAPSFRLT